MAASEVKGVVCQYLFFFNSSTDKKSVHPTALIVDNSVLVKNGRRIEV